jgi:[acyl-carrier-protein] S-malonyltransferase
LKAEHGITVANTAKCVGGHSLGEYSALAAAGTFSLADTARLLRIRGLAMQSATPVGIGAMAAILALDFADVAAIAAEAAQGDVCQAANDNSSGQVVISGHRAAVDRACELAKARGAKRAILLPVSAPFHCALMQPAADAMAEALQNVTMHAPVVPLIANVVAGPITDVADIRQRLVEQVTGTVRWRECVGYMAGQGVHVFCEIGAGKVLTGLLKKNAAEAQGLALGTPDDITAAVTVLKQG